MERQSLLTDRDIRIINAIDYCHTTGVCSHCPIQGKRDECHEVVNMPRHVKDAISNLFGEYSDLKIIAEDSQETIDRLARQVVEAQREMNGIVPTRLHIASIIIDSLVRINRSDIGKREIALEALKYADLLIELSKSEGGAS